ncbi:Flagellar hook-length control protein FliK [Acidithiobacillus caldus ATCC 51756]|uniref:Flagellar hook-length control protein FliK n=1 Tax=Acidithiobacillus caldus (strain ATCC 51756 / DSM 8584 / KU) TaxID=637389 RepID=A0A059ZYQ7_ACICK|nr:Flagellar hook-length control protein FliK [Acidithiobacillus caldus ATCC 51756]
MELSNIPVLPLSTSGSSTSSVLPKAGTASPAAPTFDSVMQAQRASVSPNSEAPARPEPGGGGTVREEPTAQGADPQEKKPENRGERGPSSVAAAPPSVAAAAYAAGAEGKDSVRGVGAEGVSVDQKAEKTPTAKSSPSGEGDGKDLPPASAAFPFPALLTLAASLSGVNYPGEDPSTTTSAGDGPKFTGVSTGQVLGGNDEHAQETQQVLHTAVGQTGSLSNMRREVAKGLAKEAVTPGKDPQQQPFEAGSTTRVASLSATKALASASGPAIRASLAASSPIPSAASGQAAATTTGGIAATMALPVPMAPVSAAPSAPPAIPIPVSAQAPWGAALGQQVQWMLGQNVQQVTLQLNPAHLGPLEVHLDLRSGGQANALFISAHPEVRAAIEAAVPQLQQSFAAMGLQLGQASVDSGAASSRRFNDGGRSSRAAAIRLDPTGEPGTTAPVVALQGLVNTFV